MAAQKKLGLALGGGGARGLAHLGVLRVLERVGVEISFIAGTSMGGLVGAFYAAGIPLRQIATIANHGGPRQMLGHLLDLTWSAKGFLRGERVSESFAKALGRKTHFHDLSLPVAFPAVDLRSGQEVLLDSGPLVPALRATCAVPGVFLPVDHLGMSLVDGGILNNVPADVARRMGAEVVLAINVLPDFSQNELGQNPEVRGLRQRRIPSAIREQLHVQMIMLSALTAHKLERAEPDLTLIPEISEQVGLFVGYGQAKETIEAGARAMEAHLPELLERLGLEPEMAPVRLLETLEGPLP